MAGELQGFFVLVVTDGVGVNDLRGIEIYAAISMGLLLGLENNNNNNNNNIYFYSANSTVQFSNALYNVKIIS